MKILTDCDEFEVMTDKVANRMLALLLYACVAILVADPAWAQVQVDVNAATKKATMQQDPGPIAIPAAAAERWWALSTLEHEQQVQYDIEALRHRGTVLRWQYWSSIGIFFVVLAIIGLGLVLSYQQFRMASRAPTESTPATTLKLGSSGIEVNSSVIGLLILVLALGFFYLYLKEVYPVTLLK